MNAMRKLLLLVMTMALLLSAAACGKQEETSVTEQWTEEEKSEEESSGASVSVETSQEESVAEETENSEVVIQEGPVLLDDDNFYIVMTGRTGENTPELASDTELVYELYFECKDTKEPLTDYYIEPQLIFNNTSVYCYLMLDFFWEDSGTTTLNISKRELEFVYITDYAEVGKGNFFFKIYDFSGNDENIYNTEPVYFDVGEFPGSDPEIAAVASMIPTVNEQVLYEDENVTLYATGMYQGYYGNVLQVKLENKSEENIAAQLTDVVTNGWNIDTYTWLYAPAGDSVNEELYIVKESKMEGFEGIGSLGFDVRLSTYEEDNGWTMINDYLTPYFWVDVAIEYPAEITYPDSGETIYSDHGLTIKYQGIIKEDEKELELQVLIINDSDQNLFLDSSEMIGNGTSHTYVTAITSSGVKEVQLYNMLYGLVKAHTRTIMTFGFYQVQMDEYDTSIAELQSIEVKVHLLKDEWVGEEIEQFDFNLSIR